MTILLFLVVIIMSLLYTITTPNTVYSICSLAIAFINISAIYLLLGFDYLALTILIIYVGAIAILFLFIVMLLNIKTIEINILKLKKQLPFGIIIIFIFFFQFFTIIYNIYYIEPKYITNIISNLHFIEYIYYFQNNIKNLNMFGNLIYTSFNFFIIISSLILLLSMLSAIILSYKKKINVYSQSITIQVYRDINKTIRQVK